MNSINTLRILVLAPTGADARNAVNVLTENQQQAKICESIDELCADIHEGCAGALITEEAVSSAHQKLREALQRQPPWSDLPIVLITSGGAATAASNKAVSLLGPRSNLILMERPLRVVTLLATVQSALRARLRQYEIRDLLEEREALLASLEKRVSERTVKLKETIEELESFSYSVSHDLRSPLRALQGYAEILEIEYGSALDTAGVAYLNRIQKAATRMDQLTRDLLLYSRVSQAGTTLDVVDLDPLIRDVIDQYPAVNAARQNIRLSPPLGQVIGHGPSLIQCFSNLIENALKFVRPGVEPEVRIYSENSLGRVRVFVGDNGRGIEPKYHPRIFEIFERIDGESISGTGIGLAIVKKAVGRMGGTISVRSELNKGATFCVDLKAAD